MACACRILECDSTERSPNGHAPASPALGAERGGGRAARGRGSSPTDARRALLGRRRSDGGHAMVRGIPRRLVRGVDRLEHRARARWRPIDPFPFSFLTLVVSLEAIFLSIFVLISQNNLTRLSEQPSASRPPSTSWPSRNRRRRWRCSSGSRAARHTAPGRSGERELAAPTDIHEVVSIAGPHASGDACRGDLPDQEGHPTMTSHRTPEPTSDRPERRSGRRCLARRSPESGPRQRRSTCDRAHRAPRRGALWARPRPPDVERQDRRLHQDRPRSGGVSRPRTGRPRSPNPNP